MSLQFLNVPIKRKKMNVLQLHPRIPDIQLRAFGHGTPIFIQGHCSALTLNQGINLLICSNAI